jgi:GTPase involved in cell partitioning and DNA repair
MVPEGTIVSDLYSGEMLADLANAGDRWLAAAGVAAAAATPSSCRTGVASRRSPSRASTARSGG